MDDKIDVVIIGRNVEKTIKLCINALKKFNLKYHLINQILYVDSNSNDNTISIVKKEDGITVIKTYSKHPTACKGRYNGFQYVKSPYVAFIDGDMEIIESGFLKALRQLKNEKLVITNRKEAIFNPVDKNFDKIIPNFYNRAEDSYTLKIGGFLLADRDLISRINFHIEIPDEEESDLISQVNGKFGKKVFAIAEDGYIHWNYNASVNSKIRNYLSYRRKTGYIQSLFWSIKENYFLGYMRVQKRYLQLIGIYIFLICSSIISMKLLLMTFIITAGFFYFFRRGDIMTLLFFPFKLISGLILFLNSTGHEKKKPKTV